MTNDEEGVTDVSRVIVDMLSLGKRGEEEEETPPLKKSA